MSRLILIIAIFLLSFTLVNGVAGPGPIVPFTPGAHIDMTGSNTSVRFDIASDLYGYGAFSPYLLSSSRKFDGAFYGSGIGWVMFSTGTYQVSLNCGAQSLSTLTANCTLSGTGWSELIGDI